MTRISPVSLGEFNVDASDAIVDPDSGIAIPDATFFAGRDLRDATAIVITIEAPNRPDISPSDAKMLAGPIADGMATLSITDDGALGDVFADVAGYFVLETPTAERPDENRRSGVWFMDRRTEPPRPGLSVPDLPKGWIYSGWVMIDDELLPTGRFLAADEADESAPFSGPLPGHDVPGEDFLENAPAGLSFPIDLAGAGVMITVEPKAYRSVRPFPLVLLAGAVPEMAAPEQTNRLLSRAEDRPRVHVSLAP